MPSPGNPGGPDGPVRPAEPWRKGKLTFILDNKKNLKHSRATYSESLGKKHIQNVTFGPRRPIPGSPAGPGGPDGPLSP